MLGDTKRKISLVLLLLAGVLFWNAQEIRRENKALREQIQALSAGPSLSQLRAVELEIEELNDANKDLYKLRNEMTQLRRQKQEMEKLRRENQQLEKGIKERIEIGTDLSLPAGFVFRTAMVDAGFATPEATLQTFFRSIALADFKRYNECQAEPKNFRSPGLEGEMAMAFRRTVESWSNFPGYYVAASEIASPDKVVMQAKTSTAGEGQSIILERTNNTWKISKETRWN